MKKMSLKVKMVLTIVGTLVVVMGFVIGFMSTSNYNQFMEVSRQYVEQTIGREASKMASFFDGHYYATTTLASTLELAAMDKALTREEVDQLLKNVLSDQPNAVDSWAVFEPNAFDGQDSTMINRADSDDKGRFVPLAFRDGSGYGIDKCYAYDTDSYYLEPKKTSKPFITEPIVYKIGGVDVNMVTISVPIIHEGKFLGVAGIDIDVKTITEQANQVKLFESGYVKLISATGVLITHPNKDNIGKPAEEFAGDAGKKKMENILAGNIDYEILYSTTLKKNAFKFFMPFQLTDNGPTWILGSTIPIDEITKKAISNRNNLMIGIGLGILFLAALTYWYIHKVTLAISKITSAAAVIATGDLDVTIDEKLLSRHDEIGHLSKSFEDMKLNLRAIVLDLLENSTHVNDSASKLTTVAEQASVTADDIGRTVEEIAKGASDQAVDTERGSAQIIEFGGAIESNQRAISHLNEEAKGVIDVVGIGTASMNHLSQQAKKTGEEVKFISEGIVATYNSVSRIKEVSSFIASISEQTNLLALNASIEAARAGDAGRGFAVVADEIRKLAEASKQSTNEIDEAVKKLIGDAEHSVEIANSLNSVIESQLESVLKTSDQFSQISGTVERIVTLIEDMDHSSKQLYEGKERMIDLMTNLSAIAEENAASTEETAASTEEQTAAINEIANMIEQLTALSRNLRTIAEQFKL